MLGEFLPECGCERVMCSASNSCMPHECSFACAGVSCLINIRTTPEGTTQRLVFIVGYSMASVAALFLFAILRSRHQFQNKVSLQMFCLLCFSFAMTLKAVFLAVLAPAEPLCRWTVFVWALSWLLSFLAITALLLYFIQASEATPGGIGPAKKRTAIMMSTFTTAVIVSGTLLSVFPSNRVMYFLLYGTNSTYGLVLFIGSVIVQLRLRHLRDNRSLSSSHWSVALISQFRGLQRRMVVFTTAYCVGCLLYIATLIYYSTDRISNDLKRYIICQYIFESVQLSVAIVSLAVLSPMRKQPGLLLHSTSPFRSGTSDALSRSDIVHK
jgi:hypothetical protein